MSPLANIQKLIFVWVFILGFVFCSSGKADIYGLAEATTLSSTIPPIIEASIKASEKANKELEKTVLLKRRLLKAEIIRNSFLAKKVFLLEKIKKNISRVAELDFLKLRIMTLNNKIWIYNNSFRYQSLGSKGK